MGCCSSADSVDRSIEGGMKVAEKQELQENKLLLLGTGSSGKSTLFRGLRILKGEKISASDINETRAVIRGNLITTAKTLWEKCMSFGLSEKALFGQHSATLSKEDSDYKAVVHFFQADAAVQGGVRDLSRDDLKDLGQIIKRIWDRPAIKFTFANRCGRFAVFENMDYFFDRVERMMESDYYPTDEDMLKCRQKTTGITTWEFQRDHWVFKIFDVGGQRNERRKWIQLFSGVHAVLFLAALNHFNYVLYEKEDTNAMHESLRLFEEIVTQKYFRWAEIILFLNKDDLFKKALGEGQSLKTCFNRDARAWEGDPYHGPEWPGPDYEAKEGVDYLEDADFVAVYEAAKEFILQQYLALNPVPTRVIYNHVLCGTDTENLSNVFDEVQQTVIRANLVRRGMSM